jgi:beta-lactamase regulating signal transducer with metallopeptidase domain
MSFSNTYLLNVALHGAVLSIFATGLLALLRRPGQRSFMAIAGLLTVGILPWITTLRPERRVNEPVAEISAQPVSPTLPVWTVVTLPMPEEKSVVETSGPVADAPSFVFPSPLACVVFTWAAGTAAGLILLAIAVLRVCLWKRSLRSMDEKTWQILTALPYDVPSRRLFLLSESTTSPCVTGFFRPRIVLPRFLLEKEAEQQLRWAVGHELAHLRAGDSRWMIVFSLIRCVNWWNPFVHLLVSRWADAREQLCDLHATGLSEDRSDYGKFLVTMARRITGRPPLAVTMAKRAHANRLEHRIAYLLESRADSMKPLGKGFVGIGTVLLVVATVSVSILRIKADTPGLVLEASSSNRTLLTSASKDQEESTPDSDNPSSERPAAFARDATLPAPETNVIKEAEHDETQPDNKPSRFLKFTSKLLVTGPHIGFADDAVDEGGRFSKGALFSESQARSVVESAKKDPASKQVNIPSMCIIPGQEGMIEIIREVPGNPKQVAARDPQAEAPFVGIRLTLNGRFVDEDSTDPLFTNSPVELEQTVDYHHIPGIYQPIQEPGANPPRGLDPDKIVSLKRTVRGRCFPHMTICIPVGEIEPGRLLVIFTRVDPIDPTGRPLDPEVTTGWMAEEDIWNRKEITAVETVRVSSERKFRDELKRRTDEGTLPLPENPGSLVLRGTLVDLPLDEPRPQGEGLVIGLTPSTAQTAEQILAMPGAKIRKLKDVEIPFAKRATPWPEFSGLNVSAVISRDRKLITIASHAVGKSEGQFPNRWNDQSAGGTMNFGIRTKDPKIERRLLITVDAKP